MCIRDRCRRTRRRHHYSQQFSSFLRYHVPFRRDTCGPYEFWCRYIPLLCIARQRKCILLGLEPLRYIRRWHNYQSSLTHPHRLPWHRPNSRACDHRLRSHMRPSRQWRHQVHGVERSGTVGRWHNHRPYFTHTCVHLLHVQYRSWLG